MYVGRMESVHTSWSPAQLCISMCKQVKELLSVKAGYASVPVSKKSPNQNPQFIQSLCLSAFSARATQLHWQMNFRNLEKKSCLKETNFKDRYLQRKKITLCHTHFIVLNFFPKHLKIHLYEKRLCSIFKPTAQELPSYIFPHSKLALAASWPSLSQKWAGGRLSELLSLYSPARTVATQQDAPGLQSEEFLNVQATLWVGRKTR